MSARKLPANEARCDGLLPTRTHLPNGMAAILWSKDCPKRDECKRYLAHDYECAVGTAHKFPITSHWHGVKDDCPDFMATRKPKK